MCTGLESFSYLQGMQTIKDRISGFRPVDSKYKTADIPDFNKIKSEISRNNIVLLNLGVYKKQTQEGKTSYNRQYGHWVMATGQGSNGYSSPTLLCYNT